MNIEEMIFENNCNRIKELENIAPLNFAFEIEDDVIDDAPFLSVYTRVDGEMIVGQSEGITTKVFVRSSWDELLPYINEAMDNWFYNYTTWRASKQLKQERATMAKNSQLINKEVTQLLKDMFGIKSRVHVTLYDNK